MFRNKIIIVFALISILILGTGFTIIFLRSLSPESSQPTDQLTNPTRIPQSSQEQGVTYNKEASDELLRIVRERPSSPVTSDSAVRENLISSLGNASGTLFVSEQITIEYVLTPNTFQIEIKTINVDAAKEEAISWFISQGISEQGICYLPVAFYLNFDVSQSLESTDYTFNPLPEFCL